MTFVHLFLICVILTSGSVEFWLQTNTGFYKNVCFRFMSSHSLIFFLFWVRTSPDIAVEFLQKSAPSPIRKLHKKYASHVARYAVDPL